MQEDILNRLNQIGEEVAENNRILKKIDRARKVALFGRIFYWVIIIALAFGAYYYIEPYVGNLLEVYSGAKENVERVGRAGETIMGILP